MAIGQDEVASLARLICDSAPAVRDEGAEQAADLVPDMSNTEAETVAATLVRAAAAETDATAVESQLNALAKIAFTHGVREDVLGPVFGLTGLTGSAAEHLSDLRCETF